MKKLILIFAILFYGIFCNAQTTVSVGLIYKNIFSVDDNLIVSGYIVDGNTTTFKGGTHKSWGY